MKRLAILFLFVTTPAFGQQIELPEKVVAEPCKYVRIKATVKDVENPIVKWVLPDGLDRIPQDELADKTTLYVLAARAGKYRLAAFTAKDNVPSDAVYCELHVIGDSPVPPPDPPPPETGLQKRLRDALAKDGTRERLATVISVWEKSSQLINSKAIVTTTELFNAIEGVEKEVLGNDLANLRAAIWTEMRGQFNENFILTTPQRISVQNAVNTIVKALEGL